MNLESGKIWKADFFFITRPILFFPGWATLLIGWWYGREVMFSEPASFAGYIFPELRLLAVFTAFGLLMAGTFVLNQIRDKESDRLNNKLYFIHDSIIKPQAAWLEASLLIIAGMAVLACLASMALLITGLIFALVTGYLYNFPPFTFKDKVYSGLFSQMIMGESAFALGFFAVGDKYITEMFFASIPILLFNTGMCIVTTLPDLRGDLATEKHTIGSILGEKNGSRIGAALVWAGIFLLPLDHIWSWIVAGFSLPFVFAFFTGNLKDAVRALKYAIFGYGLAMAIYHIWFAVLGIVTFFSARFYYRKRFGIDYPNFTGQ